MIMMMTKNKISDLNEKSPQGKNQSPTLQYEWDCYWFYHSCHEMIF